MQKFLSLILTLMGAGLAFIILLYVASVVIPVFLVLLCAGILWVRYRQHKAARLFAARRETKGNKEDVIDVEYEVIDNK